MVRYEDPPGKLKHIRLGKISPEIYAALVGFPGVKSIVRHEGGSKGGSYKEHPHYHVWYESEKELTNQTIRNNLKKLLAFKDFSGQIDWSFRNHDSWEVWSRYVCRNSKHEVLLSYKDIEAVSVEMKQELATLVLKPSVIEHIVVDGHAVVNPPRKSRAMKVQFVDWLIEHKDFRRCETITPDNSAEMLSILTDELAEYWEMAFTLHQSIQMLNHAHWVFANPPERTRIRSKFHSAILKSNYLV